MTTHALGLSLALDERGLHPATKVRVHLVAEVTAMVPGHRAGPAAPLGGPLRRHVRLDGGAAARARHPVDRPPPRAPRAHGPHRRRRLLQQRVRGRAARPGRRRGAQARREPRAPPVRGRGHQHRGRPDARGGDDAAARRPRAAGGPAPQRRRPEHRPGEPRRPHRARALVPPRRRHLHPRLRPPATTRICSRPSATRARAATTSSPTPRCARWSSRRPSARRGTWWPRTSRLALVPEPGRGDRPLPGQAARCASAPRGSRSACPTCSRARASSSSPRPT